MEKEKNQSIETVRGMVIVLVVMGHVIGSAPDGGMKIDFPSSWRYLYLWIDYKSGERGAFFDIKTDS
ncbi:MAG: hypothetical protein RSA98_04265 [Odoribacter sp.]